MMQARSELAPMISKAAARPTTQTERTIETGSSPWIFAWAAISFVVVLACVTYLSTVSF
jgi:hypothetical protein